MVTTGSAAARQISIIHNTVSLNIPNASTKAIGTKVGLRLRSEVILSISWMLTAKGMLFDKIRITASTETLSHKILLFSRRRILLFSKESMYRTRKISESRAVNLWVKKDARKRIKEMLILV